MKPRSNKVVSLLDFIKTGKFDIVELGYTKTDILTKFCKPDDKSYMGHDLSIWRYSTFELHFQGDVLYALWCDGLFWLRNPSKKQFKIEKWVLKDLNRLTFSYFCLVLTELNIQFSVNGTFFKEDQTFPDNIILSINDTDVAIYFENLEEQEISIDQYKLIAIGASKFKSSYKVKSL